MLHKLLFLWLFSCCWYASADSQTKQNPTTVIELFTSQGCYSCPPADELLGELAEREDIIALSCHVTYWNYIGWKDTFSRRFCDNRQQQYQSALLDGNRGIYTPQMVVNGRYAAVGSRRNTMERIIAFDQKKNASPLPIDLRVSGGKLIIQLPPLEQPASSKSKELLLFGTSGKHLLSIARGENAGKKLPYFHPVEYVKSLGRWEEETQIITIVLPEQKNIKDWVVIAQHKRLGEIAAVGHLSTD